MPTPNPFFLYPFGTSGDDVIVPNTGASTGTMSYQYGFTPNYEANLLTDPAAIPVPRTQMNQLFFDITTALQIVQTQGLPSWVATGSGGPTNYPKGAMVNYLGLNYISMVATNSATPGTGNNWLQLGKTISLNIPAASSVSLAVSNTAYNIGSISLPPGRWRVDGNMGVLFSAASPTALGMVCWTRTDATPGNAIDASNVSTSATIPVTANVSACTTPVIIVDVTTTTSVYLQGKANFSGGTADAFGNIMATLLNYPT